MKTASDLLASVRENDSPPEELSICLQALWWDSKGDWDRAHEIAQDAGSREGDWVHAYLHRVEGDLGNAGYWYSRAGKPARGKESLRDEWEELVTFFLASAEVDEG
jgi:hypothetical protein